MTRAREKSRKWIVFENTHEGGYLNRCLHCGAVEEMRVPTPVESFLLRLKAFDAEHKHCKPSEYGAPPRSEGAVNEKGRTDE